MPLNALVLVDSGCRPTAQAQAVDGTLTFDATMPDHGHGMNVEPIVSSTSAGEFLIEGINLHMPGTWKLDFSVDVDGATTQMQQSITSVLKGDFNPILGLNWLLALAAAFCAAVEPSHYRLSLGLRRNWVKSVPESGIYPRPVTLQIALHKIPRRKHSGSSFISLHFYLKTITCPAPAVMTQSWGWVMVRRHRPDFAAHAPTRAASLEYWISALVLLGWKT